MTVIGEISNMVRRIRIVAWVAMFATLLLGVELFLILSAIWEEIDFITQGLVFGLTLIMVMALGYQAKGPKGVIKRKRG